MTALFGHLSSKLCAATDLSSSLSEEYFQLISSDAILKPKLESLLTAYQRILDSNPADIVEEIKKQLLPVPEFKEMIKKIIKLWYLGRIENMKEQKGAKHYYHYDALIWSVLHAHPPGLTGGYFGYWAYKPET